MLNYVYTIISALHATCHTLLCLKDSLVAVVRLLLAIAQTLTIMILQQAMLPAELTVAEAALSDDRDTGSRTGEEGAFPLCYHASSEPQHQMQRGLLLNVVITKSASILELLPSKNQSLLIRRYALLILDLALDIINSVGGLDLKGDGFASKSLYEYLHAVSFSPSASRFLSFSFSFSLSRG